VKLTTGEKIMVLRTRKGYTLQGFSKLLKENLQSWGEVKNVHQKLAKVEGGLQTPTEHEIQAIAKVLDVDSSELLADAHESNEAYAKMKIIIKMLSDAKILGDDQIVESLMSKLRNL
jgi:hypothetical protein